MKRKYLLHVTFFCLLLPPYLPAGNLQVFKKECMSCHGKDVAMVRPVDKARIQWERFFRRDVHTPRLALDERTRREILTFLYDHAADSDQPMVPGL